MKDAGCDVRVCSSPRHLDGLLSSTELTLSEALSKLELPLIEAADVNQCSELLDWINEESLGLGFGPAWIFGSEICDAFAHRFINFMGIRMPHYMGGAHYTWQILSENRIGAVNLQLIEKSVNTGSVVFNREYYFHNCRTPIDFFEVAEREELTSMKLFLSKIQEEQNFSKKTIDPNFEQFFPYLNSEKQGWIDWSWTGEDLERFINAFGKPYLGASTNYRGNRVYLHEVYFEPREGSFHPFQNGMIYRNTNLGLFVATSTGGLIIKEIKDSNGNSMCLKKFKKGSRFFTSLEQLEKARKFDAKYDGSGLVD